MVEKAEDFIYSSAKKLYYVKNLGLLKNKILG
jgi:hypothetical protein